MARKHYEYDSSGKMIYAVEDGEIILDQRDHEVRAHYYVIPDCQPFKSMVDGSIIHSRSTYRDHLKQHGCIEVGNDRSVTNPVRKPLSSPPGLKEEIIRVANEKLR